MSLSYADRLSHSNKPHHANTTQTTVLSQMATLIYLRIFLFSGYMKAFQTAGASVGLQIYFKKIVKFKL